MKDQFASVLPLSWPVEDTRKLFHSTVHIRLRLLLPPFRQFSYSVSDVISRWTIDLRSLERGRHRGNSFEFFLFSFLFVSSFFGSNMNIICSTEKNNNVWNLEWERRKIIDLLFIIRILPNFSFHRKKSTLNKQHSVYPVCDSKIIFFNRLSLLIIRGT